MSTDAKEELTIEDIDHIMKELENDSAFMFNSTNKRIRERQRLRAKLRRMRKKNKQT